MLKFTLKIWVLTFLLINNSLKAEEITQEDKNILALLDWGGSTASALYGVVESDLNKQVSGDRYERLAREITYKVEMGRSSSALVTAPMDLVSAVLYGAAIVNPEPISKTAALLGGYASRKFGESISEAIISQANSQADSVLKRALDSSNITVESLEKMSPEQFTHAIEELMIGDRKLADLLKNSPQSLRRIQAHANELHDTAQLATLKTAQKIQGTNEVIVNQVNAVTKQLEDMGNKINNRLDGVKEGLTNIQNALREQSKDIVVLQKSVEGNSAALQTLAQVSSMSWTTDQKLAALDSGLFSDLNDAQLDAMKIALLSQKKTEDMVANLNSIASDFNDVAVIARNLGADPQIIRTAQAGQLIAGAVAAYAQGNYLGTAVAVSSMLGIGGGASDSNTAMMSFLKAQFEQINRKLDEIYELQKQTLNAVLIVTQQLEKIQMQMQMIERDISISLISLQYLQLSAWQTCQAMVNRINSSKPSLAVFKKISDQPELSNYVTSCYAQYSQWFDANIASAKWGWDILDYKVFPASEIHKNEKEVAYYGKIADETQQRYDATRDFFLKTQEDTAINAPALFLSSLLETMPTAVKADARNNRIRLARDKLIGYRCGQTGIINQGISTPLCMDTHSGEPPREDIWEKLLYPKLTSPVAARLIDIGISLSLWSTFSYIDKNKMVRYVPSDDISHITTSGLTAKLQLAKNANRRGNMIARLEWLAQGYLLQQSMMYGDYITQLIVDALYDPKVKALVPPPNNADVNDPRRLAFLAIEKNEVLARNTVVVALRRALATSDGVIQTTAFGLAIGALKGTAACDASSSGAQYMKELLPGWRFTRAETDDKKKTDPALNACITADPNVQLSTGLGVTIGNLFVKSPLPHTLEEGEFEVPASLRLAQQLLTRLAAEQSDLNASSWIKEAPDKDDVIFVRQLLSSQCLIGSCLSKL